MKIAIAGYGVEGESSYRYYSKDASSEICIVDERNVQPPSNTKSIIGADAFNQLMDLI